jgi:hypothetical protein
LTPGAEAHANTLEQIRSLVMTTIPMSAIVTVNPSVLAAGGLALDINTIMLTQNTRLPIGAVQPFSSQLNVGQYFGYTSMEYQYAGNYFAGFDNSNIKPGTLFFSQYNTSAQPAWLRGGSLLGMTLSQLQALNGTLQLMVNGTMLTSGTINLSAATSFSAAASIIQSGFTSPSFTVTYDSIFGSFIFTTTTTGPTATITACTPTYPLAQALGLTSYTAAVTSQGAAANTGPSAPAAFLTQITQITQNWVCFMLLWDPDNGIANTIKMQFANWINTTNKRYAFVCWDVDQQPTVSVPDYFSMGQLLANEEGDGVCLIQTSDISKAAFICGAAASIDFTEHNGRITFAFKRQAGLIPDITNESVASNLLTNHYNFYGAYATANQQFNWFYNGSVSGEFLWFDSYIDQVWLNSQFQLALAVLLDNEKSIPYNKAGYALISGALLDPVNQALDFGAIRAGVTLSQSQIDNVNNAAGMPIDQIIYAQGYYIQVRDALPQVRQARGSPPVTVWYCDGQSVQQINVASIELA